MSVVIEEIGQELARGQSPSGRRRLQITGTDDKTTAYSLAAAATASIWGGLVKQNVRVREVGDSIWKAEVQYGVAEQGESGDVSWSFEIGSETLHITQAVEHIASYAPDGETAPDHKGAIGVRRDGSGVTVDGTDIIVPVFTWEETHYVAYETVASHSYIETLEQRVATMNSGAFRIWESYELLLLGVSGAKRGEEPVALTFRFASSRTESNIAVGDDITVAEKKGHDYLWIEYQQEDDDVSKTLTSRPLAAHVERVYDATDWSSLGLPDPWS
jgi:hypothetical protein